MKKANNRPMCVLMIDMILFSCSKVKLSPKLLELPTFLPSMPPTLNLDDSKPSLQKSPKSSLPKTKSPNTNLPLPSKPMELPNLPNHLPNLYGYARIYLAYLDVNVLVCSRWWKRIKVLRFIHMIG